MTSSSIAARKFFAATSREALRLAREALGSDAMVLTSRVLADKGVEIVAMAPADMEEVVEQAPAESVVLSELHSMRGMLEEQMASLLWNEQQRRDPVRGRLLRTLLGAGFSAGLSRAMLERLPTGQSYAQGMAYVRSELMRVLPVHEDENALLAEGGVYALMGPTGVGKTTTTAKLAARCVMRFGAERIALVTTDSYRIGAYEQLRIYGQILDVPVYAVKDAADLHLVLKDLRAKHLVLIDTVGMSQRDRAVASQIAMLCSSGERPVKRLLLLNAASHGDTLNEVVHAYRNGGGPNDLAGCIFTKVDEATHTGALIDTVIRHRLPVHYVSSGQKVPENLMLAERTQLIDGVFQPRRHAALFTATPNDGEPSQGQGTQATGGESAEVAQALAEAERLRVSYQQLIRAMAHDAQELAQVADALAGAPLAFAPARGLWRQAGDVRVDSQSVLDALMALAREEVATGCDTHVLALSGHLGLQASDSGDVYHCQGSLLLSDRSGLPLAAPRQWLSTAAAARQPGLRQAQWLRQQDFGANKTVVQLLPALPDPVAMASLPQGTAWLARAPVSTTVIDPQCGKPITLARLALPFDAGRPASFRGKPALQCEAQLEVRLRSSPADAPALRCVATRLVDARSGKLLSQTFVLCNLGPEIAARQVMQWQAWATQGEPCLRLMRQGLQLCGGVGEPGDAHMHKRLLIAAQVATTVWRLQWATGDWAERSRALLVQLTGKAARAGRPVSASVLFAGMDKLFALLEALGTESAALPDAAAAPPAIAAATSLNNG
ncbi:flagellar biosynthesis protein FlhF [Variovorax sp. LARHSF232]